MLPELTRDAANAALLEGVAVLIDGRDPLGEPELAGRYYAAIAQYIAPRVASTARFDFDVCYDESEAIELVTNELELEAIRDADRLREGGRPVLPRIVGEARDPIAYLIRAATNIPARSTGKESNLYPGWVYRDVVRRRRLHQLDSLSELAERGVEIEAEPRQLFDEDGWAAIEEHTLRLVIPETPPAMRQAVTKMVGWSVAALPQVSHALERNAQNRKHNRVIMACELFSEDLEEDAIRALHNLLWGPSAGDGPSSSLLVHVALVRRAHQRGEHDPTGPTGRESGNGISGECETCLLTALSGERLRALVNTYADNMVRTLARAS